ncbi:membrane steroid-binding protein 1-like [Iris pallida]|uniref:Membrane steroid-binding protein 1-like n=1 Tax=Iris pallida TaxID=29817 RepID=A0AAX6GQG9_IRIPA|nr:membrane steroid-binding protein 1-like [Iris pallida]
MVMAMGGAMELWGTVEQSIVHYTGLAPATFFTVLAVALAFFHAISGFLESPPPPPPVRKEAEPLPPPVQLGEVSEEELRAYDGSDPNKPLLMAIKGQIYDVTQSRMFYGPGGPYASFAGKDASRALAKMSFEEKDLTGDISGLGPFELDALNDWEYKFRSKYTKVGTVKRDVPATDANASEITETSTQTTERGLDEVQVEHIVESKEGHPSVTVAKADDAPEAETEHVVEPKEVALEESTKE